jgi:hypothetical protein
VATFSCPYSPLSHIRKEAAGTYPKDSSIFYASIFFFSLFLQPPWALSSVFQFHYILQTIGLLGRVISSSQGLYLNTGHHKHRINTYAHQTSILCVGFEPMIPASERANTVHTLDLSAAVTGYASICRVLLSISLRWSRHSVHRNVVSGIRRK